MPLGGRYDMSVHGNMFQENIKLEILKIFQFENFEFQYQKYLTTEKYFEDQILDNFCFLHQIDFSTPI